MNLYDERICWLEILFLFMRFYFLFLVLLLVACVAAPPDTSDHPVVVQRDAELDMYAAEVVWNGTFQRWDPIPEFHVILEPSCQNEYEVYGISSPGGTCVLGYAGWPGDGTHRWIVWYFWEGAYSRTALAHELNHVRLGLDPNCAVGSFYHCDGDYLHTDESWKTLVPEAIELLKSVNL